MNYPRVASLRTVEDFRRRLAALGIELPVDEQILAGGSSPLAQPLQIGTFVVGNRFCVQPMEGWDGTPEGCPSELTIRRWRHFGSSGAKLIWGGEAVAVAHDGRANPRQLWCRAENEQSLGQLFHELSAAHRERFGSTSDLLVGLQLTHSGRFSRPNDQERPEPRIAYHHPLLDARLGIAPDAAAVVLTDDDLRRLIDRFIAAAEMARRIGFHFVDIKHCHGYLLHELLSAYDRGGDFGGPFENRTRFLREVVAGIRARCPGLMIGVRLSAFDTPPYVASEAAVAQPPPAVKVAQPPPAVKVAQPPPAVKVAQPPPAVKTARHSRGRLCHTTCSETASKAKEAGGAGVPRSSWPGLYPGFGCDRRDPFQIELSETVRLLRLMRDELAIELVNVTAGSPYYNPHIQRPALFPPSDSYPPPEDPLLGCARQIEVVRQLRRDVPGLPMIGSAYTYLQEYLPHVAQAVVREGWVDLVGLGRMVLSYPDLPADVLERGQLDRHRLCRTFSDCTAAPRGGLVSGCYPLDPFYRDRPEHRRLKEHKARR